MAPSIASASTHYALIIDAGSSGSRLQIYSWRDPGLERAEILAEVRDARAHGLDEALTKPSNSLLSSSKAKWWWPTHPFKGKGKAVAAEMEMRALRRLVRVAKGVEGEEWVKRVEPGISTTSPRDVPGYLAPLLEHALDHIPPSQQASTPIYLLATAGMRLLPPDRQQAILRATCDTIRRDYPFAVDQASPAGPCGDSVRIISGEEEGIWGWVAVNYLMDGFGHAPENTVGASGSTSATDHLLPLAPLADPPSDSSSESVTPVDVNHHSPTFGFLDMGGASTQLAFSPTAAELARSRFPPGDLSTISLRLLSGETVEWPVFAASWLGFGTNRVRERYVEQLVRQWTRDAEAAGTAPDRSEPIVDPCLPSGLVLASSDPARHPAFTGAGSFSQCLASLKPLLAHNAPCPAEHCLFGGLPTPHIDFEREDQRGFIGISEYWYTAQQVLGLGGVWDWAEWERGMNGFCGKAWAEIESTVESEQGWLGAQIELSRLQMQCFKGAWVSNVLHEGIGIPRIVDIGGNDTLTGGVVGDTNAEAERRAREKGLLGKKKKHHFQSMEEVDQTAISWTLGKAVIEASKAVGPLTPPQWPVLSNLERQLGDLGVQAVWAYAFVAFFLLACVFTSLRRRSGRGGTAYRRSRKPSISGLGRHPSPATSTWLRWPLSTARDTAADLYAIEEGAGGAGGASAGDSTDDSPAKNRLTPALTRFSLWSRRLGHALRRNFPFGSHDYTPRRAMRHASMPLTSTMAPSAFNTSSYSQPPSPRRGSSSASSALFFTPASLASLSVPVTRTSSSSPSTRGTTNVDLSTASSTPSSPPRLKASTATTSSLLSNNAPRPHRPRQNSSPLLDPRAGGASAIAGSSSIGGWNDPPIGLFSSSSSSSALAHSTSSTGYDVDSGLDTDTVSTGMLTPTACSGGDHGLSRNSSRVNLSDIGLAQRTASRATTPQYLKETP